MEQQYIYWKTGTGCLVWVGGLVSATLVAVALIHWFALDVIVVVVAWLAVCVPFIPLSFRADRLSHERRRVR